MKVLDLFSGIGGFSLGLERAGMETVAFCEIKKYQRSILRKHWPGVPIFDDVKKLNKEALENAGIESIDVICGGFPCQDLSQCGRQEGIDGDRSSLYREMLRIISDCRPRYAIFENVPGLLTGEDGRWFAKFLYDLASVGFDAEWHCIEAGYIGATHKRDRVWIVAYPSSEHDRRCFEKKIDGQEPKSRGSTCTSEVATYSKGKRCKGVSKISKYLQQQIQLMRNSAIRTGGCNLSSPVLCGADDDVPNRLDRIRSLGNAVVPQIPEAIGLAIMQLQKSQNGKSMLNTMMEVSA